MATSGLFCALGKRANKALSDSKATKSNYRLEDCVLNLIPNFHGSQSVTESVLLSSAGVYHLDIVVTDDNE